MKFQLILKTENRHRRKKFLDGLEKYFQKFLIFQFEKCHFLKRAKIQKT